MPEERPTRLAGGGEPTSGKKISKKTSLIILGSVIAIGGVLYLMRKKKQSEEPTVATEAGALTSQAFIPVTGENVAGLGSGGGGYSTGGSQEANSQLLEYINLNNQKQEHREEVEKNFLNGLIEKLGTGGGPPGPEGPAGPQGPPAAPPASPTPTPSPPTKPASCPSAYPHYNPAKGKVGPQSCYKIGKCNNKSRPVAHDYQSGPTECVP